jgi:hypothetical protein
MFIKTGKTWVYKSRPFCNPKGISELTYTVALPPGVVIDSAKTDIGQVLPFSGNSVYNINIPQKKNVCVLITLKIEDACKVECPMKVMGQWSGNGSACTKQETKSFMCFTCKEIRSCLGEVCYTARIPRIFKDNAVVGQSIFPITPSSSEAVIIKDSITVWINGVAQCEGDDFAFNNGNIVTSKTWGDPDDSCKVIIKYFEEVKECRDDGCREEIVPRVWYGKSISQNTFFAPPTTDQEQIPDGFIFTANGLTLCEGDDYTLTLGDDGLLKVVTNVNWGTVADPCKISMTYYSIKEICKEDPCECE